MNKVLGYVGKSNKELMEEMDKMEKAANVLLGGSRVTFLDHEMAAPLMRKYHELANEVKRRSGVDVRPSN